jgi:hypothetical protein
MKEFVKQSKADQIVVNGQLTPKQIYNLEKLTGVQVIDRGTNTQHIPFKGYYDRVKIADRTS